MSPIIQKIRKLTVPLILIPSIFISFFPGQIIAVTLICFSPLLFFQFKQFCKFNNGEIVVGSRIIILYFIFCLVSYIRGIIDAQSVTDWINLLGMQVFAFILYPMFLSTLTLKDFCIYIKSYIVYGFIATLIIYFNGAGSGFTDVPHMIGGVFIIAFAGPYIKKKTYIIVLLLLVFVLLTNLGTRTCILNISVCLLILFMNHIICNEKYKRKLYQYISLVLLVAPLIFLYLGLMGIFNIFKIGDIYETSYTVSGGIKQGERNLLVDSRTSIYTDVFSELDRKNAYLWGLGINGKTQTSLVDKGYDEIYKEGRRATESGMLNYIQYGGFIGLLMYYSLIAYAACLALWRSNNRFCIFLGIWLSFKLFLSFIEDPPSPNVYYFFIILTISLCYNERLRHMNNTQIKQLFNYIFYGNK